MPESVEMPAPVRTTMRPAASTQPRTRPMTASRSRSLIGRILYTLFGAALPDPLPDDPLPLVESWLKEAAAVSRTATAMTLATVTPDGRAAARMVICRGFDARAGWLVFYTDRESDKGRDLAKHPQAALVFHWEALERQVRVDGPVTLAPDADSDRYWATRAGRARGVVGRPARARARSRAVDAHAHARRRGVDGRSVAHHALDAMTLPIAEHVPLGPLTTLGVGGAARWFVEAADEAAVRAAHAWARERHVPLRVL